MIIGTLNVDKMIRQRNIKRVYNHNLNGPGSLFDPAIFGTGDEKKEKFGYIDLGGKFIDPTTYIMVSRRIFRDLPNLINGSKKFIIAKDGTLTQDPDGKSGLKWLYDNFDKIHFKGQGKELNKYTKEDFFISKILVMPLHYRDMDTTSGTIKVDEINQYYIDIIRATKMKESQNELVKDLDTSFLDMKIQGLLANLVDHLANMTFFKKGAQRQLAMGRSVDYSSRTVISAPEVKMTDVLGDTPFKLGESQIPLHHILNMYPIQIISKTHDILMNFYDLGLMNIDKEEYEYYFNDDFIKEKIKAYYYSYKDRSDEVTGPNGEKFIFNIEFDDSHTVKKYTRGITYMELFFIAFMQIRENVRMQFTRFPAVGKGSVIFGKVNPLTLNTDMGVEKIYLTTDNNTPLYELHRIGDITPFITKPSAFIFEETQKMSNLLLNMLGGDYD